MFVKKWILTAAMTAGMATGASAATLSGASEGVFTSASGGNICGFNGNSSIAWGDPDGCPDVNNIAQDDSTLTIQDFGFNENVTSKGTSVQIGQLDWSNEVNTAASFRNTAIADITLNLTSPLNAEVEEALAFNIRNTAGNPSDVIDIRTFSDFGVNFPRTLGNVRIDGFSFGVLSPIFGESLTPTTVANGVDLRWINPEGNTSSLAIYANVAAVPLPAAGWLMIAGLGGLAAVRRRRKNAAA